MRYDGEKIIIQPNFYDEAGYTSGEYGAFMSYLPNSAQIFDAGVYAKQHDLTILKAVSCNRRTSSGDEIYIVGVGIEEIDHDTDLLPTLRQIKEKGGLVVIPWLYKASMEAFKEPQVSSNVDAVSVSNRDTMMNFGANKRSAEFYTEVIQAEGWDIGAFMTSGANNPKSLGTFSEYVLNSTLKDSDFIEKLGVSVRAHKSVNFDRKKLFPTGKRLIGM